MRRLYCCLWKTIADAPLLPAWKRWQELEYRRAKIFAHRDAHLYDAPTADAHSTGQFWRAYGQRAGCDFVFIHPAPISSSFLSESPSHWRNARPRPYTVLAGGNGAHSQRLVRLAAYRCL